MIIDKTVLDTLLHEGRLIHHYLEHGSDQNFCDARKYDKLLMDIFKCGIGIIPRLYSSDKIIYKDNTIKGAIEKTQTMIRGEGLITIEGILKDIEKRTIISLPVIESHLATIKNIIEEKINNLLPERTSNIDYHVEIRDTEIILMGAFSKNTYCSNKFETWSKQRPDFRLIIDNEATLYYDSAAEVTVEGYDHSFYKAVVVEDKWKIVVPKQQSWLDRKYDRDYMITETDYENLHPLLKKAYSYSQCNTNRFVVDYLYYQVLMEDYDGVFRATLDDFRSFVTSQYRHRVI